MAQPRTIMPMSPEMKAEIEMKKPLETKEPTVTRKPDIDPTLVPEPIVLDPLDTVETDGDVVDLVIDEAETIETKINQKRPGLLLLGLGILAAALLFRK